jgi:hypothetical protein
VAPGCGNDASRRPPPQRLRAQHLSHLRQELLGRERLLEEGVIVRAEEELVDAEVDAERVLDERGYAKRRNDRGEDDREFVPPPRLARRIAQPISTTTPTPTTAAPAVSGRCPSSRVPDEAPKVSVERSSAGER